MLSPEGRCKTLDASADGYVRAEACGVLHLTVTSPHQAQHSPSASRTAIQPLALIAATAVNQDGRSSSLTAPNGPAQQAVIRAALAQAGAPPQALTGLQMHGTGQYGVEALSSPLLEPHRCQQGTTAITAAVLTTSLTSLDKPLGALTVVFLAMLIYVCRHSSG